MGQRPEVANWPFVRRPAADSRVTAGCTRAHPPWSACGAPGSAGKGAVMSVKHVRTAVAALALVTVAAIPAHADPWGRDHARGVNPTSSPADHALHARSAGLNQRYGLGASSSKPLVVYEDSSS